MSANVNHHRRHDMPGAEGRGMRAVAGCGSSGVVVDRRTTRDARRPAGVTLLELLVVIIILLMITAAAIPIMMPAMENRRMREAARVASTFISGARSRAIQTGREVGVQIQRFNGNPWSVSLAYVEVPPPYGGDTLDTTVTIRDVGNTAPPDTAMTPAGRFIVNNQWFTATLASGALNNNLIRVYDEIQINYQGPRYTVMGPDDTANPDGVVDSGGPIHFVLLSGSIATSVSYPWTPTPSRPMPFQIFRQPMRSSDTPVQLPDGIVVDLLYSGMGLGNAVRFDNAVAPPWPVNWSGTWQTTPPAPFDPVITFTPNGAVGHVITNNSMRATGPIYLLLGRRELMPDAALVAGTTTPEDKNIFDSDPPAIEPDNDYLRNFWITIGYQTGLVTVAENARNLGPVGDPPNYLQNSRSIARTAQSIGGR